MQKTYSAKPTEVTRRWILIDAADIPLGRMATEVATYLTGKNKPMFTPHIDCGDFVVVINAAKLVVTGNKLQDKMYYRHSGYPGALKEMNLAQKLAKDPASVIEHAVKGMIPKNKLASERMQRLRVFVGEEHVHTAQQPVKIDLKSKKAGK